MTTTAAAPVGARPRTHRPLGLLVLVLLAAVAVADVVLAFLAVPVSERLRGGVWDPRDDVTSAIDRYNLVGAVAGTLAVCALVLAGVWLILAGRAAPLTSRARRRVGWWLVPVLGYVAVLGLGALHGPWSTPLDAGGVASFVAAHVAQAVAAVAAAALWARIVLSVDDDQRAAGA